MNEFYPEPSGDEEAAEQDAGLGAGEFEAAAEVSPAADAPAEPAEAVQSERASLRGEIPAMKSTNASRPAERRNGAAKPEPEELLAKQQTLAFWNRMHEIVSEHAALQMAAESAATEEEATKLATLKARINRFAAKALKAIPTEGVDRSAVALSRELGDWHERSGELYDRAVSLWESAARTQGHAVLKEWESAQNQLRNEARLLGDKIAAVRDSLSRRFGEEFREIPRP